MFFSFGHKVDDKAHVRNLFFHYFLQTCLDFCFSPFFVIHYLDLGDYLSLTCELCCCACLGFIFTSTLQLLFIHNVVL